MEPAMSPDTKELRAIFQEHIHVLGNELTKMPWDHPHIYANWLTQTYFFVRHTTTFLAILAGKAGHRHPDKHEEYVKHLREESGHEKL